MSANITTTGSFTAKGGKPTRRRAVWGAAVPPSPIRNKAQHLAAMDELMRLGRLMDSGKATPVQKDAAHVLKLLVLDYESARFGDAGMADSTPVERLRYLMDEGGMTPSDLGRVLGDRPLGFRILSGQRELSKAHIRKLSEHFKVDPSYFMSL